MSALSDIIAKLYPEDFESWKLEEADEQSRKDYITFGQLG